MVKAESGRIKIRVTDSDIAKAHQNDSFRCVVAQALARTMPDAHHIDVDTQTIRWSEDGQRYVYLTPYSVQGYVIAFDAGDDLEPFEFVLDSRRRVPVRQSRATEAGKAISKAKRKAETTKARAVKTAEKLPMGEATPTQVERAEKEAKTAERELSDARTVYQNQVLQKRDPGDEGARARIPPKVFKTRQRTYGQRVLRINQQADA